MAGLALVLIVGRAVGRCADARRRGDRLIERLRQIRIAQAQMRQRGRGRVRACEGVAFTDLIEQLIGGQIAQLGGERGRQALRGRDVQRQIILPIDLGDDGQLHHAAAGEGHVGIDVAIPRRSASLSQRRWPCREMRRGALAIIACSCSRHGGGAGCSSTTNSACALLRRLHGVFQRRHRIDNVEQAAGLAGRQRELIGLRHGRARRHIVARGHVGQERARFFVGVAGHHGNVARRGRLQDQMPQEVADRRAVRVRASCASRLRLGEVEGEIDRRRFERDRRGEIAQRHRLLQIGVQLRHGFVDRLIGDRPARRCVHAAGRRDSDT